MKTKKTKKSEKNRKEKTYYQTMLFVVSIVVIALLIQNMEIKQSLERVKEAMVTTTLQTEKETNSIIEELKKFPELEPYLKYPAKVTLLTQEEIDKLSETQPAIYKGFEAPLYKIEFNMGTGNGLLVLYNDRSKKIVRMFEISLMILGA